MALKVEVVWDSHTIELSIDTLGLIPATNVVLLISGATRTQVRLDGRLRPFQATPQGLVFAIDLSRSTGFHHLHIAPGYDYWFGTEDAKLRLDGIREMLRYLREEGLAWSGQLFFSNGGSLVDPRVIYGWLDHYADPLLAAASEIAHHPRHGTQRDLHETSQGSRGVSLAGTMALLRRRGRELLEESVGGPIEVGGKSYSPRKVLTRVAVPTIDTVANRRTVWLVLQIVRLLDFIRPDLQSFFEIGRCREWHVLATRILAYSSLASLRPAATIGHLSPNRTIEETLDARYATVYAGTHSLEATIGWTATEVRTSAYAYVRYSDEIYQAFVAYVLAAVLGAVPSGPSPLRTQPSFVGNGWEIYCGIVPPPSVLRSWRSYSGDPDDFRPDILIRRVSDNSVVIGDAKYRNDGRRASATSKKELMAYMAAFDAKKMLIFYPPDPKDDLGVHDVAAFDREIIEVTVSPVSSLRAFLAKELLSVLDRARVHPSWRDPS
jgi:hypothetical protein